MPYIINKLSNILKTLLIGFSIINIGASVPYFNNQYGDDPLNEVRVESLIDLIKSDEPSEQDCDLFVESLFQLIKDGVIRENRLKEMLEILAKPNNIQPLQTLVKRMYDAINNPLPVIQNDQLLGDRAVVEGLLGLVFSDCELLKKLLKSDVCMKVFSEALLTMICKQAIDTSALRNVLSAVKDSGNVDQLIRGITFNVFDDDMLINTMDSARYMFSEDDQLDNFLKYLSNLSSKSDSAVGLLLYLKLIATVSERMPIDDNPQLAINNLTYMYDNFDNYILNNEYIKERAIETPKEDPENLNRLNVICNDTQK